MAKFSFQVPKISEGDLTDREAVKKVQSYLWQMNEQLRYMMMNLDTENLAEGAITEGLLADDVKNLLKNLRVRSENAEAQIKITADGLGARLTNTEQNVTALQVTAQGLRADITTAEGNITTLQATAQSLTTQISNAQSAITNFQQTAQAIGLSATGIDLDAATGAPEIKGSNFIITKDGISINSTGALTVNTTQFKLDENGNARFGGTLNSPTGNFGGMTVNSAGMYRSDRCVQMLANNGNFGAQWNMYIEEPTVYDPDTGEPEEWGVTTTRLFNFQSRRAYPINPNEHYITVYEMLVETVLEAVEAHLTTAKIDTIMIKSGSSYVDKTSAILAL